MATTINADTSTGGAVVTGDGSGVLALQAAGVTKVTINSSGMTLANPLPVASGGTGSSSATFVNLATNVTGTLPVANGGTGLATTPANGQLDIGNGTGFTRTTLTAGTGITITNASGSITITGSASGPTIGLVRALAVNCILP
jgi:hypothetical protein